MGIREFCTGSSASATAIERRRAPDRRSSGLPMTGPALNARYGLFFIAASCSGLAAP